MDIATIIGIISGLSLVIISISFNSGLELFVNYPAMMIVAGGTFAAVLIAYPLNEVFKVMMLLRRVFQFKLIDPNFLIQDLVNLATKAKKEGVLVLDKELKNITNDFLRKGLQLIVDGVDGPAINNILQIEVVSVRSRHRVGWEIFAEMGKYAPAFGMIGTLIGLIQMLATLDTPSTIGPKMGVALITTFYGAFLANLVLLPMSVKLKRRSQQESVIMNLIIEAIKSIRLAEHPRLMEDKLAIFLSETEKKKTEKSVRKKTTGRKNKENINE